MATESTEDEEAIEPCKSFDSHGDILPLRKDQLNASFDTAHVNDDGDTRASDDRRPPNPYENASAISKLLFIWPRSLMTKKDACDGENCPFIEESDLPDVLDCDASKANLSRFHELWAKEKARAAACMEHHQAKVDDGSAKDATPPKDASPSLARAMRKEYLSTLWFIQPCMFAASVCKLAQPLALGFLLQSLQLQNGEGYMWAGVLVFSGFVVLICQHQVFWWTTHKGMQYRASAVAAIYDKSLRLADSLNSSGKAINLAANDAERFFLASQYSPYLVWSPLLSIGILGVGWRVAGWAFAVGFLLLVLVVVPFQLSLGRKFASLRSDIASITDERVALVSQAIAGVRVMKMNNYEDHFLEKITSIRKKEIASISRVSQYRALNESMFYVAGVSISSVILLCHVMSGGVLTPTAVFTTMALVNVAQLEITKCLAWAVMVASEATVSAGRIQAFLQKPELLSSEVPLIGDSTAAIVVSRATCHWNPDGKTSVCNPDSAISKGNISSSEDMENVSLDPTVALRSVTLRFNMGSLTCVIGGVGSGKSALLQMLAGELPLSSGYIRKQAGHTIAYASQAPFIMQGTVRENILFGLEFQESKYDIVCNACSLDIDFNLLRNGDRTIVGDRGALSGGQCARIALARAFYRDADTYLLDDPLAAVDSKVGRQLFYSVIQELGVKRGKCVVLATHQHQFIGDSRCILMNGGLVACVGSYEECAKSLGTKLAAQSKTKSINIKDEELPEKQKTSNAGRVKKPDARERAVDDDQKEQCNSGHVSLSTFIEYGRAMPGGLFAGFLLLLLFVIAQSLQLLAMAMLGRWASLPDQMSGNFLATIAAMVSAVIILAIGRGLVYFHLVVEASRNLHDGMAKSVLTAKMSFFDTNPLGRILNRFSADIGIVDDLLPITLYECMVYFFMVIGAVVSALAVLPFALVFIPPIFMCLIRVRKLYLTASREMKRMEGLARSPIFAVLGESMDGLATIRSNDAVLSFQRKFWDKHDAHGRAFFAFISCMRWFGFCCDGLVFIFIAIASFSAVAVSDHSLLQIDPNILGLALTMLMQLSGMFQYAMRQSAELVNQIIAVERIAGFNALPSEAASSSDYDSEVGKEWPSQGTIEVIGLNVRYRPGLGLALRNVSFKIRGGCRTGVVGRTGSGKSSLVQSLLRLLEADEGQIILDSVDISKLGLSKLRRSISVIPQSPVLYGGVSLRSNLDPFNDYSDEDIHEALLHSSMLDAVHSLPLGINSTVAEGGSNFSVGQRQLLCLARALLRKSKVLVLDEPTANVDSHTDKILQDAVADNFADATIIAVAHRLDTVIDYDKILVLGSGGVLEYDSPARLIKSGGAFCTMVNDTGDYNAQLLKARAAKNVSA